MLKNDKEDDVEQLKKKESTQRKRRAAEERQRLRDIERQEQNNNLKNNESVHSTEDQDDEESKTSNTCSPSSVTTRKIYNYERRNSRFGEAGARLSSSSSISDRALRRFSNNYQSSEASDRASEKALAIAEAGVGAVAVPTRALGLSRAGPFATFTGRSSLSIFTSDRSLETNSSSLQRSNHNSNSVDRDDEIYPVVEAEVSYFLFKRKF